MGEAKYRKLNDPNYGKPVKTRGLILSIPMTLQGDTISFENNCLDPQDLRSSLMYWDRLSLPTNNILGTGIGKDEEYLISAGVLYRPHIFFSGSASLSSIIPQVAEQTLIEYEREQKGVWSISSGKNSITNLNADHKPGTLFEILNAVPVPGPTVPLAEILEFKAKRRDELLRYREHFEALVARVAQADDMKHELLAVLKEVDEACVDLLKTTREWQFPVMLSNINATVNFDLEKAIKSATGTYLALTKTPLAMDQTTAVLTSVGAAITSQFSIKSDIGMKSIRRPISPYRYAYHVQRDLK